MIVFDIETGALPESDIIDLFDPDAVKVGNLKDPVKIRAKQKEAKQQFLERAALSALTGQVLAVGFMQEPGERGIYCQGSDHKEHNVLEFAWEYIEQNPDESIVGFYSNTFDLPFMIRRSFILGVDVPHDLYRVRYFPSHFIDLLEVWQCGDRQASAKLHEIDRALGGQGKPDGLDGGDFARLFNGTSEQRKQALDYLRNDLDMTWRVAEALQVL